MQRTRRPTGRTSEQSTDVMNIGRARSRPKGARQGSMAPRISMRACLRTYTDHRSIPAGGRRAPTGEVVGSGHGGGARQRRTCPCDGDGLRRRAPASALCFSLGLVPKPRVRCRDGEEIWLINFDANASWHIYDVLLVLRTTTSIWDLGKHA